MADGRTGFRSMDKITRVARASLGVTSGVVAAATVGFLAGGGYGLLVGLAGGLNASLGAAISGSLADGVVLSIGVGLGTGLLGGIVMGAAVWVGLVTMTGYSVFELVPKSFVSAIIFWIGYGLGPALERWLRRLVSGRSQEQRDIEKEVEEEMLRMMREDEDAQE